MDDYRLKIKYARLRWPVEKFGKYSCGGMLAQFRQMLWLGGPEPMIKFSCEVATDKV
jgi:hypothetical protein